MAKVSESEYNGTVIILDRGILDPKAYMSPEVWQKILQKNGWSEVFVHTNSR
jgi:hypothetical protein